MRKKCIRTNFQPWGSRQRKEEKDYSKTWKECGVQRKTEKKIIVKWKCAREAVWALPSCGLACVSVSERGAAGMFWWLWASTQTSDDNANWRSNLVTSLFTLGIKLKNTTSNFIPGFPHHTSQCDIYLLARCPFFLSLTPPFTPLAGNTV